MKLAALNLALIAVVSASQHAPLNPEGSLTKRDASPIRRAETLDKRTNDLFIRDTSISKRHTGLISRSPANKNKKETKGKTSFPDASTDDPKNLSKPGFVQFVMCKDKEFGGECIKDYAEFLLYIKMEEQAPDYAGQVSSIWVEDGGLCWFYKSLDCQNDKDSFGRMGGEERDLAHMKFDGGSEQNFDNYFHCFFCQEGEGGGPGSAPSPSSKPKGKGKATPSSKPGGV